VGPRAGLDGRGKRRPPDRFELHFILTGVKGKVDDFTFFDRGYPAVQ